MAVAHLSERLTAGLIVMPEIDVVRLMSR